MSSEFNDAAVPLGRGAPLYLVEDLLSKVPAALDFAHQLLKKLYLCALARLLHRIHIPVLSSEAERVDA